MSSTIFTAQKVIDGSFRGAQKKGGGWKFTHFTFPESAPEYSPIIFPLRVFCVWLDIWDVLSFHSNLTFLNQWWSNWSKKKTIVRADGSLFFILLLFFLAWGTWGAWFSASLTVVFFSFFGSGLTFIQWSVPGPPTYNCDAAVNNGETQRQKIQSQQHCTAIVDLSPYCFGFFLLGIFLAIRYNPSMMMPSKA